MNHTNKKRRATALRREGKSLNEISKSLAISKSTASIWCRDVILSKKAKIRLASRTKEKSINGLRRYSEAIKTEKLLAIRKSEQAGADQLGSLDRRDIYCIGLGLYWGEGYKKGNQEFGFTNSDPGMISFYLDWLYLTFGVNKQQLTLRVSINSMHKVREQEIVTYWSRLTGVPTNQFTKTNLIKTRAKKVYEDTEGYVGTLRIKVKKGTTMRRELLGAIDACRDINNRK